LKKQAQINKKHANLSGSAVSNTALPTLKVQAEKKAAKTARK
jgi:hypothetical protein